MKVEVDINTIEILNKAHCVYLNGTENPEGFEDYETIDCNKCLLREIEHVAAVADVYILDSYGNSKVDYTKEIIRDLCFAIWHDKILEGEPIIGHH